MYLHSYWIHSSYLYYNVQICFILAILGLHACYVLKYRLQGQHTRCWRLCNIWCIAITIIFISRHLPTSNHIPYHSTTTNSVYMKTETKCISRCGRFACFSPYIRCGCLALHMPAPEFLLWATRASGCLFEVPRRELTGSCTSSPGGI